MNTFSIGLTLLVVAVVGLSGGFVAGVLWAVITRDSDCSQVGDVDARLDNESYPRTRK
jgi:hypothetical protein